METKQIIFRGLYTEVIEEVLNNIRKYLEDDTTSKDYVILTNLKRNLEELKYLTSNGALLDGLGKEFEYLHKLIDTTINNLYTVVDVETLPFSDTTLKYISYDILEDSGLDIGRIYLNTPKYTVLNNYLVRNIQEDQDKKARDYQIEAAEEDLYEEF